MQGHVGDPHALVAQGLQHRFVEMQPAVGAATAPAALRKHGLVTLLVLARLPRE